MFFLVRSFFWICVVAVLMPTGITQTKTAATGPSATAGDILARAGAEATAFCVRDPGTCKSGADAARVFGSTLDQGARIVTAVLSDPAVPLPPKPARPKARASKTPAS